MSSARAPGGGDDTDVVPPLQLSNSISLPNGVRLGYSVETRYVNSTNGGGGGLGAPTPTVPTLLEKLRSWGSADISVPFDIESRYSNINFYPEETWNSELEMWVRSGRMKFNFYANVSGPLQSTIDEYADWSTGSSFNIGDDEYRNWVNLHSYDSDYDGLHHYLSAGFTADQVELTRADLYYNQYHSDWRGGDYWNAGVSIQGILIQAPTNIPEPASFGLVGLASMLGLRRRPKTLVTAK